MSDWLPYAATAIRGVADLLGFGADVGTQAWQKQAQETTWAREDTAIQRRVADLKAAGLSPVLAAGQGASTSPPIRPVTPRMEGDAVERGMQAEQMRVGMIKARADIAKSSEEAKLIQLQQDRVKSETRAIDIANAFATATNPTKQSSMELGLEFDKLFNPQRLQTMVLDNTRKGVGIETGKVELQLAKLGVQRSQWQLIADQLKPQEIQLGLRKGEVDLVAKQIAVEIAQTRNEKMKYEFGAEGHGGAVCARHRIVARRSR